MSWVKEILTGLSSNGLARVRPIGESMRGKIESGQLVTIQNIVGLKLSVNDVVFIRWKNNYLLHLVLDLNEDSLLIGNTLGKVNGWISKTDVLGKVVKIE